MDPNGTVDSVEDCNDLVMEMDDNIDCPVTTNSPSQIIEINKKVSNGEHLLPVHFLPEGRQCYDWINDDLTSCKSKMAAMPYLYQKEMNSPEHKQKTNAVDSITYSKCNMYSSLGENLAKEVPCKLLKAAEEGKLEELKEILLKHPTLINSTDSDGYTALHRASYSGHEEVLLYLLDHGANVNAKTHDGWQPIHCATRWNNINICKILLEHKADINATTKGLQTPLHFASLTQDSSKILEMFLLNADIRTDITNAAGDTAYDLAHRNGPQVKLFDLVHEGLKI